MKTKNIFNRLALAMLLPAMLLTTACSSSDDDAVVNNNENINKNGYPLQVTVNVTREGDDASSRTTRATYNESTKKLEFSTGDKLFVNGYYDTTVEDFAGTLDMVSEGTFSGTIYTKNKFTGTADALLAGANTVAACLLPNGYATYDYIRFTNSGKYNARDSYRANNAFALTKATAVEQFSRERATSYSSGTGFTLSPANAILNFTITGLSASTSVDITLTGSGYNINRSVTTDGSGNATFAIGGVWGGTNLNTLSLTVGGNAIALGSHELVAGKIYNVTRSAKLAAQATAGDVGKVIGADGRIYANASAAEAAKTTALAMICYVGNAGTADASSATYKGLALALTDANNGSEVAWCSHLSGTCLGTQYNNATRGNDMAGIANTDALVSHATHTHNAASAARNYNSGTHPTGTSEWFLPSVGQWNKMITASGGYNTLRTNASLKSDVDTNYWSSTEATNSSKSAWGYSFYVDNWGTCLTNYSFYVRSALAF